MGVSAAFYVNSAVKKKVNYLSNITNFDKFRF